MFQIRQKTPHAADGSILIYTMLCDGEEFSMVQRESDGTLVIKPTLAAGTTKRGYIGDSDGTLIQRHVGPMGMRDLYSDIDSGDVWDWIIKIIESGEYVVTIRNNVPLAVSEPDELYATAA